MITCINPIEEILVEAGANIRKYGDAMMAITYSLQTGNYCGRPVDAEKRVELELALENCSGKLAAYSDIKARFSKYS